MTFTKLSLCVVLLLWFCHGAHGARMLISARVQAVHELPPCKDVPGGIQNWDCYDPPSTPLPPCDFKHQNPGLDCSADPHPAATDVAHVSQIAASADPVAASDTQSSHAHGHAQQWPELPPCNFPGAIPGWDCFDPPTTPLPPCDFKHQRVGFDCWPKSPPASKATKLTDDAASGGAFTSTQSGAQRVQGMLPPCNFPGAIPGWDCFDPPQVPLPPCDFKHQRAGFDCWPREPPAPAHP